ncbi:MAG: hypothetical protein VYD19_07160 [Myxococcota bacterium]|nr:hypothetical protein [Myxococcota bacterium]
MTSSPSLLELFSLLQKHRPHLRVDVEHLWSVYRPQSARRSERSAGATPRPDFQLRARRKQRLISLSELRFNQRAATVTMRLEEPAILVDSTGDEVREVAGVRLDQLKRYRSYRLISDGQLSCPTLRIAIESKALFHALARMGLVQGPFRPDKKPRPLYTLALEKIPLLGSLVTHSPAALFEPLAHGRALLSALRLLLEGRSERFTEAQLEALARHTLSARLTTRTPKELSALQPARFKERTKAPRYQVDFGRAPLLSLHQLPSARRFVAENYLIREPDGRLCEARLERRDQGGVQFIEKDKQRQSARRRLLKPLFDEILSIRRTGSIRECLAFFEVDEPLCEEVEQLFQGAWTDPMWAVERLAELERTLTTAVDQKVQAQLSPLLFTLAAEQKLPEGLKGERLSGPQLQERFPALSLRGQRAQGIFFLFDRETVVSLVPNPAHSLSTEEQVTEGRESA